MMHRRQFLASTSAFAFAGCASITPNRVSEETRLEMLLAVFIRTHFASRPIAAMALGWHQYDGKFVVRDSAALAKEIERLKTFSADFNSINASALSPDAEHRLNLVKATIAYELWVHEKQRPYWNNPMAYAGDMWNAMDLTPYLVRDFKPLEARFADMTAILKLAPRQLSAARENLEEVLPRPFVETAIDTADGTASFIEKDVSKAGSGLKAEIRADFDAVARTAVEEFRRFSEWLKAERLPKANDAFALGRAKYVEMLQSEFIDLSPEEILEKGMRELRAEQARFKEAAAAIDPKLTPMEAARVIQRDHPTAVNLIQDARKNLETIRKFVVDRRIVTIPSEVRAQVEETLPPFRATTFASMLTPGPFEKKALPAYYYVTPVEPDWTAQQSEEWLGAFNYYTLDVVSIHEAYPGHYVQFLAWNAAQLSIAEKIFPGGIYGAGSYAFVEGWAHYTEQMMLEEGFGKGEPKYQLAQSSEALLRLCRLICSIRLHCQGMTIDEATRFFVENAYYEEKPARSEATRGTYDPGYLYYALGKLMLLKLREDWRRQEGPAYLLVRFHDEVLKRGAPPVPLLRRLMLKDRAVWGDIL